MFGGFSQFSAAEEIEASRPLVQEDEKPESTEQSEAENRTDAEEPPSLDGLNLGDSQDEDFSKDDLMTFLTTSQEDLLSEETKADLIQKRKDRGYTESARDVLFEQQQEVWKTLGRDKEAGMEALLLIPKKFKGDQELCDLHAAYMKCCQQAFVDLVRGSRPDTLQSEGTLSKAQILDFFEATNCLMTIEETKLRLAEIFRETQKPPNEVVVEMQRDMLETLGIEKEFGISMLNRIGQDFPADMQIRRSMQEFAMNAQMAVREAVVGKEEMEKQKQAMLQLEQQQQEIIEEIQAMSDDEAEAFMTRVKDTMMSHMQMMQQMQPAQRMSYMRGLDKEEQKEMMKFQMILSANTSHHHSHAANHSHGAHSHGHSHSHGSDQGHSHGGHSHGHNHGSHSHNHSHGGQSCDGNHSHAR